jgi:hypothetical protein
MFERGLVAHLDQTPDEAATGILFDTVETQVTGAAGLLDHLLRVRRNRKQLHRQSILTHLLTHNHSLEETSVGLRLCVSPPVRQPVDD